MRGYLLETIFLRIVLLFIKVDDFWGSGDGGWLGGEYIYIYIIDMEFSIIFNCIEIRGEGLYEYYIYKIFNFLF